MNLHCGYRFLKGYKLHTCTHTCRYLWHIPTWVCIPLPFTTCRVCQCACAPLYLCHLAIGLNMFIGFISVKQFRVMYPLLSRLGPRTCNVPSVVYPSLLCSCLRGDCGPAVCLSCASPLILMMDSCELGMR